MALTRKNALFAGNEVGAENWAMLASLVATCKMSNVNPVDYIAATLRAILDGHGPAVGSGDVDDAEPGRRLEGDLVGVAPCPRLLVAAAVREVERDRREAVDGDATTVRDEGVRGRGRRYEGE